MAYLVNAQGEDVLDIRSSICDTIEEAFINADEYIEVGYEVEILKIDIDEDDDAMASYEELKEMMGNYDSYDDFIESIEDDVVEWIEENDLEEYIKGYYDNLDPYITSTISASYMTIPIGFDKYEQLSDIAKANNVSIESYVQRLINEAIGR